MADSKKLPQQYINTPFAYTGFAKKSFFASAIRIE